MYQKNSPGKTKNGYRRKSASADSIAFVMLGFITSFSPGWLFFQLYEQAFQLS